jgi:hypothetical protein
MRPLFFCLKTATTRRTVTRRAAKAGISRQTGERRAGGQVRDLVNFIFPPNPQLGMLFSRAEIEGNKKIFLDAPS